jgi:TrfA protein
MENNQNKISTSDIQKRCERMAEIARQRESAEIIQLPLWHEPKRGTPNSFIRSALFAAIQSKDRVFVKEQTLASQQGITVKFTGEQLNQEDLTIWETLVHLARKHPLGDICSFTAYGILKQMGLNADGKQRRALHSSIIRLTACAVEIKGLRYPYAGPLIHELLGDETTKSYHIQLNRKLINLFGDDDWTAIEWQQRLQLRRKPLAQALHAYFSSHQRPHPVKLKTLQELTGSKNVQSASFKRQVKTALTTLQKIGFLQSFTIEASLVTIERVYRALPKSQ